MTLLPFHNFDQLGEVSVEIIGHNVLVVQGLKRIIVKRISTHLSQHLQLSLHFPHIILLEVELDSLVGQHDEDIVVHNALHIVVSRDVQRNNLPVTELLANWTIIAHALFERN